jgi:hypothetical protein
VNTPPHGTHFETLKLFRIRVTRLGSQVPGFNGPDLRPRLGQENCGVFHPWRRKLRRIGQANMTQWRRSLKHSRLHGAAPGGRSICECVTEKTRKLRTAPAAGAFLRWNHHAWRKCFTSCYLAAGGGGGAAPGAGRGAPGALSTSSTSSWIPISSPTMGASKVIP